MRKLILFCCLFFIVACAPVQRNKYNNHKQAEFDSLVNTYYNKSHETFNDIIIKELADEYKAKVDSFFNSTKIENWELIIQGLKVNDAMIGDTLYKKVTFDLKNGLDIVPRVTFNSTYLTKSETCESDSIYNRLKQIGNLDKVIFSGYVIKYLDGYISNNPLNMSYPDFDFLVKDIHSMK